MTISATSAETTLSTKIINGLLAIKPLAEFAKNRARNMIIKRAYSIGVNWQENINSLQNHDWEQEINSLTNTNISYPDYYLNSFHAYEKGNLQWEAAWELESAAYSVHSTIYSKTPQKEGDRTLRNNYHQVLKEKLTITPQNILDIGCGVGLSTFALKEQYPESEISGLDLSPYFLSVANYQSQQKNQKIQWLHSQAEKTNLPSNSHDLVSAFLIFHELPQLAAKNIIEEAHRVLKTGGYFCMMDMNPQSEVYKKMPRYVFTLLKSTEPYLDEYFSLNMESVFLDAGFEKPSIIPISIRHRTIVARKR
ncbi:class I SAM-dependent methyltransferase [Cyanobacterium sp. Dongsha4]|uniref:class I SAM-dependent methyltransferase n=1 Tax=Cyanobacterium sp. DS4 TaxID=2878255 RepID=UPI002E7FC833|nr:methyltransferase domain-containing protein [Cyanobacterium sp. Dongsha4]WVL01301.1 methyltransferase domain-containing protein [Cyanobacterium sp. Dongsha4]